MLRINPDGTHPGRQPASSRARPPATQPRHLGAGPAQPVHLRLPARHRAAMFINDVGAEHAGRRSTTASPAPTTAGRTTRGQRRRRTRPHPSALLRTATAAGTGAPSPAARSTTPASAAVPRRATSATTSSPTTAPAGSAGSTPSTNTRHRLRHRHRRAPVDLKVGTDGRLYYLARGSGSGLPGRLPAACRPASPTHPASTHRVARAGRDVHRGRAAARPPFTYQWQRSRRQLDHRRRPPAPATPLPDVHRPPTTAPASACVVTNAAGNVLSNEAVLTVTTNQAPDRHDHRARRRHSSTPAARRSRSPAPAPTRRTARCRPAPSPGGWTSTTTPTPTRSCRRPAASPAAPS